MDIHFSCPRCDYTTSNKQSYIAHLNRKNICAPIKSDVSLDEMKVIYIKKHQNISCDQCNRCFSHRSSLSRHKKECVTPQVQAPTVLGTVKWNIDYYRKIKILKLMKSI